MYIQLLLKKKKKSFSDLTLYSCNKQYYAFWILNLYGKQEEIESSGWQFWKDKMNSNNKITCKTWSDSSCGLKREVEREGMKNSFFFCLSRLAHHYKLSNNTYTVDPGVIQI